jgi:hypothetical protein
LSRLVAVSLPEGLAEPPKTGESLSPSPATNGVPAASMRRES